VGDFGRVFEALFSSVQSFDRGFKVMMRTFGSPKITRTTGSARKPSNENISTDSAKTLKVKEGLPGDKLSAKHYEI
jgi:hypothetical protein